MKTIFSLFRLLESWHMFSCFCFITVQDQSLAELRLRRLNVLTVIFLKELMSLKIESPTGNYYIILRESFFSYEIVF